MTISFSVAKILPFPFLFIIFLQKQTLSSIFLPQQHLSLFLIKKILQDLLQEIIFGSSDSVLSRRISRLEKEGQLRKIAPRVYTSNLTDKPEKIVRRNLFPILAHLFPGAVLSHRSALEFQPTTSGQIFLTYAYNRKAELPGIIINLIKGKGPIQGDRLFTGELYVSQRERAFLENLQITRKAGPDAKNISRSSLEERLEMIVRVNGETELNQVRDRCREIATEMGWEREFERFNQMVSALLSTKSADILTSPLATARALGVPFDPARIELFEILFRELQQQEFKNWEEKNLSQQSFQHFAFFESYFSNYIEGTVFQVADAKKIIETQQPLPNRNEDSHDVLGTYQIVADPEEMRLLPKSPEEFLDLLRQRHRILLSARKNKKPGSFKDQNNFAGLTSFVEVKLVRGTLMKSFDYYQALHHPFAKAAFMMFIVSEVHPFLDGNGRIARVMMNAELVAGNQSKIIIPTVFRDDYLGVLRKLTRTREPKPYISMLSRAHEFSATVSGEKLEDMQSILERSNAFLEHTEGKLRIIRD